MGIETKFTFKSKAASLLVGVSMVAMTSGASALETLPPDKSMSGIDFELVGRDDLYTYKSCDSYNEAPLTAAYVEAGKLPPVAERLPKTPMMMSKAQMVDGIGDYGGTFRHVIGGRPEGWNWMAGQHQGWGGISMQLMQSLTRLGPLWQVKPEEALPLPNLATDWEFNSDRTTLTMNLVEGVKWSDGDPFDTEDIDFWWNDNVQNANVNSRLPKDALGAGTTVDILGPYSFRFNFDSPKGNAVLSQLAHMGGAPGPSHILKQHHPDYNSDATYESYTMALPPDEVPIATLGAYVPVAHKIDELVVMKRNPYYWKVDEECNQLPYYHETIYKLTTWDDRTTQALAGTGDYSNMENPGNYVEALKQNKDPNSPVKSVFGSRSLTWKLYVNLSSDLGVQDDYDRELRKLFRNLEFRKALSHAMDRDTMGQSVARGPFFHPHAGGFSAGSPFHRFEDSIYYGYNVDGANSILDGLGLIDSDGNGIRNFPNGGEDIALDILFSNERSTDIKIGDSIVPMFEAVGLKPILKPSNDTNAITDAGNWNLYINRDNWLVVTKNMADYLPITPTNPVQHKSNEGDLLPFEKTLADLGNDILATNDLKVVAEKAYEIQKVSTENLYAIGLIQTPAALLINKRIKNNHPGTPVYMYEWGEDAIFRERLYTPKADQIDEFLPGVLAEYK